jgi:copper ion binding protein
MLKTDVIQVVGMSCQHCVQAVTQAVTAVAGVDAVRVSLEEGTATVDYEPGAVSPDALVAAITEEGFEASVL